MSAIPERRYKLEEYFELERTSEERFEFWDGEVFCLPGASQAHSEISVNCLAELSQRLDRSSSRVFTCKVHLKLPTGPPYLYADVSALCRKSRFEKVGEMDALANPQLIIEVRCPFTHAYGRPDRFTHYKSIPTLREYLLVAQHRPHVTRLFKRDDGAWVHTDVNELAAVLTLDSLGCDLPLSEIYRGVSFDVPATI